MRLNSIYLYLDPIRCINYKSVLNVGYYSHEAALNSVMNGILR